MSTEQLPPPPPPAAASAAASAKSPLSSSITPVEAQVARAELAVYKNKAASDTLQAQWKVHLLRLAFLLALVGLHQMQSYITPCLKDIKRLNNMNKDYGEGDIVMISGWDAIRIVLKDAMEYLVALIMSISVIVFLNSRKNQSLADFSSSLPYMFANACVPVIFSLHYPLGRRNDGISSSSPSCMDETLARQQLPPFLKEQYAEKSAIAASSRVQSFPVIVLFHVIVTLSFMFMDSQTKQHENNIRLVENLRRDLIPSQQQADTTNKTGNNSNKGKQNKIAASAAKKPTSGQEDKPKDKES